MAAKVWENASSPNYSTNEDKFYPYSEVPYIGQYKLIKIPHNSSTIEFVDYWGEGRIVSQSLTSGFPDCYHVNYQYQCVYNGPDKGKKIPNRIPVVSYTNCDTSSYIKDNSVLIVTLMGAPINNSCSKDIARIINEREGKLVVFGFERSSADIRNLDTDLKKVNLLYCEDYKLPSILQGITLFDSIQNPSKYEEDLQTSISSSNYDVAVKLSIELAFSNHSNIISNVVSRLLEKGSNKVISFAYKLWNNHAQNVVKEHFPTIINMIMSEKCVKIVDKKYGMSLKLDANLDSNNDRKAWGDPSEQTSPRFSWKFQPYWSGDKQVIFNVLDVECGMFLKLASYVDSFNDREAWGDFVHPSNRHSWYLDPIVFNGELMFFIINKEYGLGLKLDANTDEYGDRRLWGNSSDVHGDPGSYGWYIRPL